MSETSLSAPAVLSGVDLWRGRRCNALTASAAKAGMRVARFKALMR